MNFRASFCGPLTPDVIELGDIREQDIIDKFESIDWVDHLRQMEGMKQEEIYYSPSLEIENKDTKQALSISVIGDPNNYEFFIFYKRPKKIKSLFGSIDRISENYMTDKDGLSRKDALDCLNALIRNDTDYLAGKIGQ